MNMRIYPVVCFALLTIVLTEVWAGARGSVGLSGLTYCPVDSKINTFLRQLGLRARKKSGFRGRLVGNMCTIMQSNKNTT